MVIENEEIKADGTLVQVYAKVPGASSVKYIDKNTYLEDCNVYQDIVDSNPFVKTVSMLVAILVAFLLICLFFLCCNYFNLESRFEELQMTVVRQQQETGLPDNFEFNEEDETTSIETSSNSRELTKRATRSEEGEIN